MKKEKRQWSKGKTKIQENDKRRFTERTDMMMW